MPFFSVVLYSTNLKRSLLLHPAVYINNVFNKLCFDASLPFSLSFSLIPTLSIHLSILSNIKHDLYNCGRTGPNDRIHIDYSISVKQNNSSGVVQERIWILRQAQQTMKNRIGWQGDENKMGERRKSKSFVRVAEYKYQRRS